MIPGPFQVRPQVVVQRDNPDAAVQERQQSLLLGRAELLDHVVKDDHVIIFLQPRPEQIGRLGSGAFV